MKRDTNSHLSFSDPRLGELRAPTRGEGRFGWRSWRGAVRLSGQLRDTALRLSGDANGPWPGLVRVVHEVLDGLDAIRAKLDAELARVSAPVSSAAFDVSAISDWDEHDEILQVEFAPRSSPGAADDVELEIYWPRDDWALNHHLRIHRTVPLPSD